MLADAGKYNQDQARYQNLVDQLYETYDGGVTLPPEYAYFMEKDLLRLMIRLARYKFLCRLMKPTDRVLEIGSGSGLGSIFMSQHCAHVTGLEVKATEIAEARAMNRRKNVEFVCGDLFDVPIEQRYDMVVALDVIEHMPIEQGRKLVEAMCRRLKPTGMLVIGTPSIYSYPYQSALSQASHVKCYDQRELVELIDQFCGRTLPFSMNDELVHTGYAKMSWYYFVLGFVPHQ
jgi:2-polyprenyl-3-methyl-5-hydroxy-6-metoxy-1,4-benzoquinol methylase